MPKSIKLAPSILACDFTRLGAELASVREAEWVHVDVMDGSFVPNISFGLPILQAARRATTQFLDVHLMIQAPERFLAEFAQAGADGLTVHVEATPHIHRALQLARSLGKQAGVAVNPGTPLDSLLPLLESVDLILLMSVNPGFGGQSFIPATLERLRTVRGWLDERGSPAELQVDGGVSAANAPDLAAAGASCLVAGSSVFGPGGGGLGLRRLREALA